MKRYAVRIPDDVQALIDEQVFFIAKDSVANALAWEERLRTAIHAIGDLPGHAVDNAASRMLGYTVRKVAFERTYLIFYHVDEAASTVNLAGFRHVARLPRAGEP